MRSSAALLCVSLWALSGCATTLSVRPASAEEQLPSPRFIIEGTAPTYDAIEVLDDAGLTVWKVRARSFGEAARPGLITYGETPESFEQVTPPQPLARNARYHLFVSAAGPRDGRLHFTVDATGRVDVDLNVNTDTDAARR